MYASVQGHIEIVKLLLEAGAEVNAHNNNGETALIIASERGNTEIVKLLREHGSLRTLAYAYVDRI